jgi:division protein CdvB (Snf7/Vps24/ESCRT-III family)
VHTLGFEKRWENGDNKPVSRVVKDALNPPGPLKPRLDLAEKRTNLQLQKLEQESKRFEDRDKVLFNKVVESYEKHDSAHANIYARELAELRRMSKITMSAKLALDQISLRIEGVSELGDVAYTLLPVINVMRDVRSGMASVNPQIAKELGDIGNLLSGIVMDAGATANMNINFASANEDSKTIMEEAAMVAEKHMSDTFPELPKSDDLKTKG